MYIERQSVFLQVFLHHVLFFEIGIRNVVDVDALGGPLGIQAFRHLIQLRLGIAAVVAHQYDVLESSRNGAQGDVMRHGAEGIIGKIHAAGVAHVTGFFPRIDDAGSGESPRAGRGKGHGGIDQRIPQLGRDLLAKIMSDEHMFPEGHAGSVLFDAARVVDGRGLARGNRIPNFRPRHILDEQRFRLRSKCRTQEHQEDGGEGDDDKEQGSNRDEVEQGDEANQREGDGQTTMIERNDDTKAGVDVNVVRNESIVGDGSLSYDQHDHISATEDSSILPKDRDQDAMEID